MHSTTTQHQSNYLGWSIFTTLCCCLPLGIAAIIFSSQVNTANAVGDVNRAIDSSRKAKNLNIAGLVIGILLLITMVILRINAQH